MEDVLYAGGVFDNAGKATPVNNVAYYAGHMWNGLSDIAQWQGPARTIYVSASPSTPSQPAFWTRKLKIQLEMMELNFQYLPTYASIGQIRRHFHLQDDQ